MKKFLAKITVMAIVLSPIAVAIPAGAVTLSDAGAMQDTTAVVISTDAISDVTVDTPAVPSNSIMYWGGKVNQHVDSISGAWMTDSDGVSGADLDMLIYCQKWYPDTTSVVPGIEQTISTWQDRGNLNNYTNTKISYQCVQSTNIVPGTIGGTVIGGLDPGVLLVTRITAVKTTATADGTFSNGWKYIFNITVPSNETHLSMKFANWMSNTGSAILPVSGNMRISSIQADNGNAVLILGGAETYTTPALNITGDLSPSVVGNQVQVTVEVAVPINTVNGSYNTSYGVKAQ